MNKAKDTDFSAFLYGPVPSRRLGYSLGIDIIPYKTCTLDCIYCQLGRTPKTTVLRKKYRPADKILAQIKKVFATKSKIDMITFSGSGEPTLHQGIGQLIREIKKTTSIPVTVLTNGTLLSNPEVRQALMAADLVVPSLDAATQEVFEKINRPHSSLNIQDVIHGLKAFQKAFRGSLWLEVMLVKGVNDSPGHIKALKKAIQDIQPDKVQLNTVVRPPAERTALPLSREELERIRRMLGRGTEVIAEFKRPEPSAASDRLDRAILAMVRRRPVTLSDIADSTGRHRDEILKQLASLTEERRIKSETHEGEVYYKPA